MENNESEIWRSIEGYEGLYEVSNLGRVRSLDRYGNTGYGIRLYKGKILSPGKNRGGYLYVILYRDNKHTTFKVHRLVAMNFPEICGQFRDELEVDHRNCVRDDNRAVNIHLVTRSENQNNPLTKQHTSNAKKGERNPMYRRYRELHPRSLPIIQLNMEGEKIAEFSCTRDAETALGISHQSICHVLKGRRKTAGGYIFRYKEQTQNKAI